MVIDWLKKIIPSYIEIRSLYWVEYGNRMSFDLGKIFDSIDNDNYEEAEKLINDFEKTYKQSGVPNWVALEYSQIYKAISMLNFLKV